MQENILRAMKLADEINAIWAGTGNFVSGDAHTEMWIRLQEIKSLLNLDSDAALGFIWI